MTLPRLRSLHRRASRVISYALTAPPGRWERAAGVLLKIHHQMGETP